MADLIKNRCHVEILMNVEQLVQKTASAQSDSFNKYEVCNIVVTTTILEDMCLCGRAPAGQTPVVFSSCLSAAETSVDYITLT